MEFDASLPIWRFLRGPKMRLEASLRDRLRLLRDYLQSRDIDRDIKKKGGDVLGEFCISNAVCWRVYARIAILFESFSCSRA